MSLMRTLIGFGLCAGVLFSIGCGKDSDSASPFEGEILGDGLTPVPVSTPDLGIIADPKTYSGATISGVAATDARSEAEAVVKKAINAAFELNFPDFFDLCDAKRVGVFGDESVRNEAFTLVGNVQMLLDTMMNKSSESEQQEAKEFLDKITAIITRDVVAGLLSYEVIDEETVQIMPNEAALQALGKRIAEVLRAEMEAKAETLTEEKKAQTEKMLASLSEGNDIPDEFLKALFTVALVNGQWKLQFVDEMPAEQLAVEKEQALAVLKMAQTIVLDVTDVIDEIDEETFNDPEALAEKLQPIIMKAMMGAMAGQMGGGETTTTEGGWDDFGEGADESEADKESETEGTETEDDEQSGDEDAVW